MASTLYAERSKTNYGPRAGLGLCSASATYTFIAALADEDVIEMVRIPAGATILDWILDIPSTGLDTGTAIVFDIGDGSSTGRFATGCVQGRSSAGAIVRPGSTGSVAGGTQYQYTSEDTIDFHVTTAPTTGVAEGVLKLTVFYTLDP